MLDDQFRGAKDRLVWALAARVGGLRLAPAWITGAALLVGVLAAVALWQQRYGLGLLLWLLNRGLDGLDGAVARLHDLQTDLGGYLDILGDFVVYALVPIALVLAAPAPGRWLALAVMLGTFYVNAASWMFLAAILEKRRHRAAGRRTTVAMPAGLIGGTETVVLYCLFILLPAWLVPLFWLTSVLVALTALQRLVWAVQTLEH